MTYCVAIALDDGLVLCSDSRTNAGSDQVATYGKMHHFGRDGERQLVMLSAGNLATTQAVVTRVRRDWESRAPDGIAAVEHLGDAAAYIGAITQEELARHTAPEGQAGFSPDAPFLIGGQIRGEAPGVYLIYPQGNFITTSHDTPYLQIGETKYGKPILDRLLRPDTPLDEAAKCALVSMDSTMMSNVTVGPPVELMALRRDSLRGDARLRLEADAAYLLALRQAWRESIAQAFRSLPAVQWNPAG